MNQETECYVALLPCGCAEGAAVLTGEPELDKGTSTMVAGWILSGLRVEIWKVGRVRTKGILNCPHGNQSKDAGEAVRLRVLSHEQARQEMLDLYRSTKGPLFYSDTAERLRMDLEQVIKVADELEQEGLIGRTGTPGQEGANQRVSK